MPAFKSDFLRILTSAASSTRSPMRPASTICFAKETVSAYIGFDPTASSLHAGGLIQIMMLHWMQKTGHRPSRR
jgi:tyrosyl-tRNA synthetase